MKISLLISLFVLGTHFSPGIGQSHDCFDDNLFTWNYYWVTDAKTLGDCRRPCHASKNCLSWKFEQDRYGQNLGHVKCTHQYTWTMDGEGKFASEKLGCKSVQPRDCYKFRYYPELTLSYGTHTENPRDCAQTCKGRTDCANWNYFKHTKQCSFYYRSWILTDQFVESGLGYGCW